jgi:hypothetical protein
MSNFQRKDVRQMSIKELEDYILKYSINDQSTKNNLNKDNSESNRKSENNSNFLSHNYIDSNGNFPERETKEYKFEEIYNLIKENIKIKSDLKQLFYLTDQNKIELEKTIKELSEENYNLKSKLNELKERIIFQQNIISSSEQNKIKIEKEKDMIKEKYENDIRELKNQLNIYQTQLNDLNLNYQNLLNDYNKLHESIYYKDFPKVNNIFEEENKQSTIEEVRNLKEYLLTNTNNILEIKDKLNEMDQKNNYIELNKSSRSYKRSNTLNSNKSLRTSYSNSKVKNNNLNNSNNKSCKRLIKKKLSNNKPKNILITYSNTNNSPSKFTNNINHTEINSALQLIEEEIFSLERKIAELSISYHSFLQKFNNENDSLELKQTLKFLQDSINMKNQKLKELKIKQQQYLFQSTMN